MDTNGFLFDGLERLLGNNPPLLHMGRDDLLQVVTETSKLLRSTGGVSQTVRKLILRKFLDLRQSLHIALELVSEDHGLPAALSNLFFVSPILDGGHVSLQITFKLLESSSLDLELQSFCLLHSFLEYGKTCKDIFCQVLFF